MADPDVERISEPDGAEKQAIRDEYDEVVLSTGGANNGPVLHLPQEDDGFKILCAADARRQITDHYRLNAIWSRKELAVYPPGHKRFCKHCVQQWRLDNE